MWVALSACKCVNSIVRKNIPSIGLHLKIDLPLYKLEILHQFHFNVVPLQTGPYSVPFPLPFCIVPCTVCPLYCHITLCPICIVPILLCLCLLSYCIVPTCVPALLAIKRALTRRSGHFAS